MTRADTVPGRFDANPNLAILSAPTIRGGEPYVLMTALPSDLHFANAWPMLWPRGLAIGDATSGPRLRPGDVTDGVLAAYRWRYGPVATRDAVFFYLYGLIHSPEFRARFAVDLGSLLPRRPMAAAFDAFAHAGRELADLHVGYESVPPWPFEPVVDGIRMHPASSDYAARIPEDALRVTRMRWAAEGDRSMVLVNERLALHAIPPEAHEYRLGTRSALDWVLHRYRVRGDRTSGTLHDPNAWGEAHGDPRALVDLIGRITRVSVETVAIVRALPRLEILPEG